MKKILFPKTLNLSDYLMYRKSNINEYHTEINHSIFILNQFQLPEKNETLLLIFMWAFCSDSIPYYEHLKFQILQTQMFQPTSSISQCLLLVLRLLLFFSYVL